MRYVFLNSLPLNAFDKPFMQLLVTKVDPNYVKLLIQYDDNVECYIRHNATVDIINKLLELNLKPSSDLYKYRDGDVLIIVSLKKPVRGQEVQDVTLDDLDIRMVEVAKI